LENVIFCHQEDANWPLSDAKTLKSKFDEIFAATRYTKALEAMRKQKTEKTADMRRVDSELAGYKVQADAAQDLKRKLRETDMTINACEKKRASLTEKMNDLREKVTICQKLRAAMAQNEEKLTWERGQLREKEAEYEKEKSSLKEFVNKDIDALYKALKACEAKQNTVAEDMSSRENAIVSKKLETEQIEKNKTRTNDERASLKSLVISHKEKIKNCEDATARIARKYGQAAPNAMTPKLLRQFKNWMDEHKQKEEDEFGEWKEENRKQLDGKQATLAKTEARLKQNMRSTEQKRDERDKVQKDVDQLAEKLKQKEIDMDHTDLESAVKNAQTQLDSAEAKKSQQQVQIKQDALAVEVTRLKMEVKEAGEKRDTLVEEMNSATNEIVKRQMKRQEHAEKRAEVNKKILANKSLIREVLGTDEVEDKRIKSLVENRLKTWNEERGDLERKFSRNKVEHATVEGQMKAKQEEILTLEKLDTEMRQRLLNNSIDGRAAWKEKVESAEAQLEELKEKTKHQNALVTSLTFMQAYMTRKNECMCCGNKDVHDAERAHLQSQIELLREANTGNGKSVKANKEIEACAAKLKSLKDLEHVIDKAELLRDTTLPEAKKRGQELKKDSKTLYEALRPQEAEMNDFSMKIERAEVLVKVASDVHNLLSQITSEEHYFSGTVASEQQQEQNKVELDSTKAKILELTDALGNVEKKLTQDREKLERFTAVATQKNTLLQKLKLQASEVKQTHDRLQDFRKRLESVIEEMKVLSKEKPELSRTKEELSRDYVNTKNESQRDEDKRNGELNDVRRDAAKCKEMEADMSRFSENPEEDVRQKEEEITIADERMKQLRGEVESIQKELDDVTQRKLKATTATQTIKNNIRVKELACDVEAKQQQIEKLENALGEHQEKLSEFGDDTTTLDRDYESLNNRFQQSSGELKASLQTKKDHEDTLRGKAFKDIEKRVREKNVEAITTKQAIKDLDKFHGALDRALMSYHAMKMEEINKTMAELWQLTYQGNDIDKIKLTHDEEAAGVAKRNYNYRMVMVKKGKEVDMRGRCSAGQKVLASLVLRLALAETFGTQCGVLALDEPTTNLDQANIRSFAIALCDIIKERMKQKNFQLIIITHDEEFVSVLSQYHCHADYFYRVGKNSNQHSTIVKHDLIDLDR